MAKLSVLFTLFCVGLWAVLAALPRMQLLNTAGYSQVVFDDSDGLLNLTLSSDERLRLFTPLQQIPSSLVIATLEQEDRYFYWHFGVNPFSLLRAIAATYFIGSRSVGASTVSMQLVRLRFGLNTKSITGKLYQMWLALRIESKYSKGQILEAYFNLLPYGGNIEGVGAASRVYFNKEPQNLSVEESTTLSVIPQNPNARSPLKVANRPRLIEAALKLAHKVKDQSIDTGILERLEFLQRGDLPARGMHLVKRLTSENNSPRIYSTLNSRVQQLIQQRVGDFVSRNGRLGLNNAAAMLVNYRTMEVKAYLGSADFWNSSIQGQVDGIFAQRSPGSALKPFLYGLALDHGLIHPESILNDTELNISNYNPENYERDFLGPITATQALVRSRNLPAVKLANELGENGLYKLLHSAQVRNLRSADFYGLALTLGGVEISMQELIRMYAMLANHGELRELNYLRGPGLRNTSRHLLSPEASFLVLSMLSQNPRPGGAEDETLNPIPWKTGTSFGFRDAWAVGLVGQFVLGVWVGNFDGKSNPALVGREAAGPLFFSIADSLSKSGLTNNRLSYAPSGIKPLKVCAISGQLSGPYCKHLKGTKFIAGVSPISTCSVHRPVVIDNATNLRACADQTENSRTEIYEFWPSDILRVFKSAGFGRRLAPDFKRECKGIQPVLGLAPNISSPQSGLTYIMRDSEPGYVPLQAVVDGDSKRLFWFIDGDNFASVAPGESVMWKMKAGKFIVRAIDDAGRSSSLEFSVSQIFTQTNSESLPQKGLY